jgi:hypothetical protein
MYQAGHFHKKKKKKRKEKKKKSHLHHPMRFWHFKCVKYANKPSI